MSPDSRASSAAERGSDGCLAARAPDGHPGAGHVVAFELHLDLRLPLNVILFVKPAPSAPPGEDISYFAELEL